MDSKLQPPDDKRCEARTKAGNRCTKWITGVRYCERHRHLESYEGGPGPAASVVAAAPNDHNATRADLAAMPLATTGDAHALLAAARRALLLGAISDKTHATIVTSVQTAVRLGGLRDELHQERRELDDLQRLSLEELAARVNQY